MGLFGRFFAYHQVIKVKATANKGAELPCDELLAPLSESITIMGHSSKIAVAKQASTLVTARLDYASFQPFMEPLLHGYFSLPNPQLGIDQLLLAYVHPADRPDRVRVRSDAEGYIYFPGIGYVRAPVGLQDYFINATHPDDWRLSYKSLDLPAAIHRTLIFQRPVAELAGRLDLITEDVLLQECGEGSKISVFAPASDILVMIQLAMELIEQVSPALREAIDLVTRRFVFIKGNEIDSFTTNRLFGTVFLKASPNSSVPFFVEELSHQCGHLILSALTVRPSVFYNCSPLTPLEELGGQFTDYRTVETLFHAVFTECLMSECLAASMSLNALQTRDRQETLGRLAFVMARLQSDLHTLVRAQTAYTEHANRWIVIFLHHCRKMFRKWYSKTSLLKFRHQGYSFDRDTFFRENCLGIV